MDFNQVINWVVPIGVILFVVSILYSSMKPLIDPFMEKLKEFFYYLQGKGSGAVSKVADYETRIVYR